MRHLAGGVVVGIAFLASDAYRIVGGPYRPLIMPRGAAIRKQSSETPKHPISKGVVAVFRYLWKLCTRLPTKRYQPSTSTKKINLKGRDSIIGGSIIIPIDISTEAMTMSIMINGT